MDDKIPDTLPGEAAADSSVPAPDPRGQKLQAGSAGDDKVMRMGTA